MSERWPSLNYAQWSATCDTLHAHTQMLGKLAVRARAAGATAPARGAAPDRPRLGDPSAAGAGWLRRVRRRRLISAPTRRSSSTARRRRRVPLTPNRSVGDVTRDCSPPSREPRGRGGDRPDAAGGRLERAARRGRGARDLRPRPVTAYFGAATRAALVLAAFRAPYRGRSTPVNAWWGSFDLAVNLFSGAPADPPSTTSSCATRWTPRRSPSAGGRATPATRKAPSTPTPTPPRTGSPSGALGRRSALGRRPSASTSSTGTTSSPAPDPHAAALELRPLGVPSRLRASASGIPRCSRAPRARPRRSSSRACVTSPISTTFRRSTPMSFSSTRRAFTSSSTPSGSASDEPTRRRARARTSARCSPTCSRTRTGSRSAIASPLATAAWAAGSDSGCSTAPPTDRSRCSAWSSRRARYAVHDHLAWGLVGVYRGNQDEEFYAPSEGRLGLLRRRPLDPGDFYALLPPRDDVHRVRTTSEHTSVSLHLLASDVGCIWRHTFDEPRARRPRFAPATSTQIASTRAARCT